MGDAEYSYKSDFSKGEVVKQQVVKCNQVRSKEMKPGYFNYTPEGQKIYVPDSRKEWVSAVRALKSLLSAEIHEDKEVKKRIKKIEEKEKKLFKKYAYVPRIKKWVSKGGEERAVWVKQENAAPYIPEVDAPLPTDDPDAPESASMVRMRGIWNEYVRMYWNEMVSIYDELFEVLNILIHKNNYFKQKASYGFDVLDAIESESDMYKYLDEGEDEDEAEDEE